MVQENSLKKLILIVGPTAVGKTSSAIDLANELNTEIISCDSMQIYKMMDIGTAKPTIEEQSMAKHHMIDVVMPDSDFNVSDYVSEAENIIDKLSGQGKVPVIVGGTGLYANSLILEYNHGNSYKNDELRNDLELKAKQLGNEFVHNILKEIDPKSADEIHYNNLKRVIRAIEIFHSSGNCKSELKQVPRKKYDYKLFALNMDREVVYNRINKRVDLMIEMGLIDEVKSLIEKGYGLQYKSMQAIGYKQIIQSLNGEFPMDKAIELIKQLSRNYAKRQITWFKKMPEVKWIDATANVLSQILEELN